MFKIGDNEIEEIYFENQPISAVYLGGQLVWVKEGANDPMFGLMWRKRTHK